MTPTGTALVTGASRGIGRGVAQELARRGFDVVATMRNPDAAGDLTKDPRIAVARLDVDDPTTITIPPGLRVLVNNAAIEGENLSLEDTPMDDWRRQFETNVFGLVEVTRRALPALRANGGGVIVNLTSAGLLVPMPFFAVYRAS
jgi:NAD(P)-dependent dehydrogenase (short-subunit alcohol dehydrogenase family)